MKNLGYSQNFLVNKKLVERLISKSNIDVTDYVIEIGPGKGIITDVLSQHAGEVVAVEYDQELYNNYCETLTSGKPKKRRLPPSTFLTFILNSTNRFRRQLPEPPTQALLTSLGTH